MEINRTDTGVKKDRNVIACTFFDDDSIRMWDLDTMNGYAGGAGTNDVPARRDFRYHLRIEQ